MRISLFVAAAMLSASVAARTDTFATCNLSGPFADPVLNGAADGTAAAIIKNLYKTLRSRYRNQPQSSSAS
jgi:hypothetical protein